MLSNREDRSAAPALATTMPVERALCCAIGGSRLGCGCRENQLCLLFVHPGLWVIGTVMWTGVEVSPS
jgi:hypothetical protein